MSTCVYELPTMPCAAQYTAQAGLRRALSTKRLCGTNVLMISKEQTQLIRALHHKKHRDAAQLFIVEGKKGMQEALASDFEIEACFLTETCARELHEELEKRRVTPTIVSAEELAQIGSLESNDAGLLVVRMKEQRAPHITDDAICLVLDAVQDPGNVGTIVRIADWYGIRTILAHHGTADFYNSKTILASMGSFTRVHVWQGDVTTIIDQYNSLPIYGASLHGENVHTHSFPTGGFLILGNESRGISSALAPYVRTHITIPKSGTAESLNVGTATGIIIDNWTRSRS